MKLARTSHAMDVELRGERTTLHVQRLREARAHVVAIRTDAVLSAQLPSAPPTTRGYLKELVVRRLRATVRRQPLQEPTELVISSPDGSGFLGMVVLHQIDLSNKRAELGCWMVESARRHGLGEEAVRLVCDWAFGSLGLERLELLTTPDNVAAIRGAERLGFVQEGRLRSREVVQGRRTDQLVYALLAPALREDGDGARTGDVRRRATALIPGPRTQAAVPANRP